MRHLGLFALSVAIFAIAHVHGDSHNDLDRDMQQRMNQMQNMGRGGRDGDGGRGGDGGDGRGGQGDDGQGGGQRGGQPQCQPPPRTWTFAFATVDPPFTYIDRENMKVVGMSMDLIQEACHIDHRDCEFIFLKERHLCWDPERGFSPGLMNRMFDACVNALPDFEKENVNAFTRPFARTPEGHIFRRQNDNLITDDIRRENSIPIGVVAMSPMNLRCLDHNDFMINTEISRVYETQRELMQALMDGQVRLAFASGSMQEMRDMDMNQLAELDTMGPLRCSSGGPSVMMRKDAHALMNWIEDALERVMRGPEYPKMCYIWERLSGRPTMCNMEDGMDGRMMPRGD